MKENLIASIGLAIISNEKVVLVRQDKGANHPEGQYGLPSRRNLQGESDIQAAIRTINDETGLTAAPEDFSEFPNNYFEAEVANKGGFMENFGWRVFKVQNFSGELKGNKEVTPEWIPLDKLQELEQESVLLPNTLNAINAALK